MTVSRVPNVEGGIQPTIVTAKGDLITAVANANPARLGVGSDGQLLTADSTSATGLSYQNNFAAGKNAIINGAFNVWQRGTTISPPGSNTDTADRWCLIYDGSGSRTITRQTFTPGTAPVAGYESAFFYRFSQTVAGTGGTYSQVVQKIEDVRVFAGQTVTISFWAKASTSIALSSVGFEQYFGSGGSGDVNAYATTPPTLTTSWVRYSFTINIPSISGKTIGTGSFLKFVLGMPLNVTSTIDIWGVQVEQGSTATAFQTSTGTIQGELAACQRYYVRFTGQASGQALTGTIAAWSATNAAGSITLPVAMRVQPTSVDFASLSFHRPSQGSYAISSVTLGQSNLLSTTIGIVTASGMTAGTVGFIDFTSTSAYLGFSAEL